ncbi:Holliday junction branch migration protein RuvA [Leptospira noguchii]|uniref:Holliday junction branch migration complex subunit RuvA n=2 Tax=Leptospira noguchii TaxID=28182 RepID=M6U3R4_9LEPT|nr:Holliday junction branch migration protein RuvA [Leptospira noguchii]EMO30189.1 Holliday junction DNA helicase RuvA, N-terminal domain protein [Leptospira interrogans serovar Bataviae str. HAI135]EKR71455.1 Holliday junction DNA helicase RuvA [Leptospira noguchii str. 2006001870]EMO39130.1 Holliday junction DNA helicase RuvA [Leptospira noguchii serovar Autumnalis str. ZUN142]EMS84613.1 Holliday junction DNA helicase RuvA, N-terminal domain protein [Leptospira noguchii str. Hook]UOG33340.1 
MISGLKGTLKKLEVGFAHIETGGITYEVTISFKTYLELKNLPLQKEIQLQIFHAINERGQKLFGFLTEQDKEFFKVMKGLQGIGELTALKILSFFSAEELYRIVQSGEAKELEKIPKVKGKTSEKIFFEVKQNLKKLELFLSGSSKESSVILTSLSQSPEEIEFSKKRETVILGLVQLGFEEKTASKEVDKILKNFSSNDPGEIIREILKSL